jgi:hypothetical protein
LRFTPEAIFYIALQTSFDERADMARFGAYSGSILALAMAATPSLADKIKNPTAVFAGLDKITGRIISFEVGIDETVQFGSLQLTPRVCYSRPSYEAPRTDTFVEVDEVAEKADSKRLFTGWMFAASPGLNAVEHPVYDLWLTECKGGSQVIKTPPEKEEVPEVMPLQNARPAKPPEAPIARRPQDKKQPTQSFFPTTPVVDAPASAPVQRPRAPMNITVGPDPARGGN